MSNNKCSLYPDNDHDSTLCPGCNPEPSLADLARNALQVQDACNLSGIVHSFSRDITSLRKILRAQGKEDTNAINMHPICVLYASKIADLTGCSVELGFAYAYRWCQDMSQNIITTVET